MNPPLTSDAHRAVFRTVSFADVLDTPLTLSALQRSMIGESLTLLESSMAVDDLVQSGQLERREQMIYLAGRSDVVTRHRRRAVQAARRWEQARECGQHLARLPLVRAVAVVGQLAINNLAPEDPIDLLVVMRPRRLWLMHRVIDDALVQAERKGVHLRIALIITTRSLSIDTRSVSVAHELAMMVPIAGADICESVLRYNDWIFELLPNTSATIQHPPPEPLAITPWRRLKERILLTSPVRPLERLEMQRRSIDGSERRYRGPIKENFLATADRNATELITRGVALDALWHERYNITERL